MFLTDDALDDLEAIGHYIAATDSPQQADYALGKIEKTYPGLYELPERGVYPKELLDLMVSFIDTHSEAKVQEYGEYDHVRIRTEPLPGGITPSAVLQARR